MSNLEELNYAIISELRDQLEAKEQMIKNLKEQQQIALSALVIIKNKEPNTWQSIQAEQAIMKMDSRNGIKRTNGE